MWDVNSLEMLALTVSCPACSAKMMTMCFVYREAHYGLRRITPHGVRIDAAIAAMGPAMASVGDIIEIDAVEK